MSVIPLPKANKFKLDKLFDPVPQFGLLSTLGGILLFDNQPHPIIKKTLGVLLGCHLINWINVLYCRNKGKKFKLKANDIVVVFGGSNGLGCAMVDEFLKFNCTVINLDVLPLNPSHENIENLNYFKCDLTDEESTLKLLDEVEEKFGKIKVVINNAGTKYLTRVGEENYIQTFKKTLQINLLTYCAVMDHLISKRNKDKNQLFIVNVASVLGVACAGRLSAYSTSKSGLIAMHESLVNELPPDSNIFCLLLKFGQLNTQLFSEIESPKKFVAPILDVKSLASTIVNRIKIGQVGEITLPHYGKCFGVMNSLPRFIHDGLRAFCELDTYGIKDGDKEKEK